MPDPSPSERARTDAPEHAQAPAVGRVGFLGLGIMGSRMAANVARAGFPLTVWTHTPGKAERWASEHGALAVDTPAAVAEHSNVVVSMVVDGGQVADVLCGEHGVADAAHPGLLCVDMSTIGPTAAREIAGRLAAREVAMIDAPVTGSSPRAEDGTLTIMCGGPAQEFERVRPLLDAMGKLIVHVGELGQGQMLKLINNTLGAANAAAVAEALLLARATSIDLDALVQVVSAGSGASLQMEIKSRPMREHDYTTLFKAAHLLKDVRLCLQEAQSAEVPFPSAAHAQDLLTATIARGHGERDYAAIIEAAEGLAGRRL
jgi:3-hydroxyisobutyrate dehydrogenase-like beta-hydroxyacid dehydrogenase